MSRSPPAVIPRKHSSVQARTALSGKSINTHPDKENGDSVELHSPNADREIEILNHCFEDVERFMMRLQQAAEAQTVLNQRKKKKRKSSKKHEQEGDLLTKKAAPPPEEEFVDIFQKIKYALCLLDRLKSSISQPNAPDLLHHIFVPLRLMVNTTGGPTLGASVVSPVMTSGAISLLQEHLTPDEKELWTSLGANWNSSQSQLSVSVPPYSPVFLDGWQPPGQDAGDPIQLQHKEDTIKQRKQMQRHQEETPAQGGDHSEGRERIEENGVSNHGDRLYYCSYDFVARNSSELSVLQGETVEVLDSTKRWWKCRNGYDQIGFVPNNILEPLSAVNKAERDNPVMRSESRRTALNPQTKYYSYMAPSSNGTSPPASSPPVRPQSMVLPSKPMSGENGDRVLVMNNELLQRLAIKRSSIEQQTAPSAVSLNYHSQPAEVEKWLISKGFRDETIKSLGILNGAQLFSLSNEEIGLVTPEGENVYIQILAQKALLEDARRASLQV